MKTPSFMGCVFVILLLSASTARSADPATGNPAGDQQARFKRFEESLSGVKLVGRFTVVGRDRQPAEEEYTIKSVTKTDKGDFWLFMARIKYGDKDYEVPLPLEVKWAGDTPMITLTNLKILNAGPYSARVLFYDKKYAGTWSHGNVGGHMYGEIVKLTGAEPADREAD